MSTSMNIGQAAKQAGLSSEMVRHYESLGLLPKIARTDSGYRQYGDQDVHTLRFIRRGRDLGFSMAEIADLLKLWQNRRRASVDVKRIALTHVADLDRRIAAMTQMKDVLENLASCCNGAIVPLARSWMNSEARLAEPCSPEKRDSALRALSCRSHRWPPYGHADDGRSAERSRFVPAIRRHC